MKTLSRISTALLIVAPVLTACREDVPIVPELSVYDASDELVMSLTTSEDYQAEYQYFQYLDTSSPTDEQAASPKFMVASNLSWRIVPDEDYDWINTFPDCGEANGLFYFRLERYTDQTKPRNAIFRIIANDGVSDIPLTSAIVVTQSASTEFVKKSAAKLEFTQNGGTKKLYITANVPWEYEINPDADIATEDLSWLTTRVGKGNNTIVDTIEFKAPFNEETIRGAKLTLKYSINDNEFEELVPITQSGPSVDVDGFPIKWTVGVAANCNYSESWASEGTIASATGKGTIRYVSTDKSEFVGNTAFKTYLASATTVDPAVQGVWPGDYLEFVSDTPVARGTILKLSFETRVSASCQKYWRLEYKDGNEWLPAGALQTTVGLENNVQYTDAYIGGSDAKANLQISRTVKYQNTTDKVDFRLLCVANYTCGGAVLSAPNTASWRLTLTTREEKNEWQPQIQCIAGGAESIVKANIELSGVPDGFIVFEGTPEAAASFKVKSDNAFSITSDASWLTLSTTEGEAGKEYVVNVECEPSFLSVTRKAVIDIASGISHQLINVIQSAAGEDLKPFVSVVGGGNQTISCIGGSFDVEVQSNVDYVVECPSWIHQAPATRGLVDLSTMSFSVDANMSASPRIGEVRIYSPEHGVDAYVKVVQEAMTPEVQVDEESVTIRSFETSTDINVVTNVPLVVSVDNTADFSVSPATLEPGTGKVTVTALSDEDCTCTVTFATTDGAYSKTVAVIRANARLLADWCFLKADKAITASYFETAAGSSAEEGTMGKAIPDHVSGLSTLEYWSVDKTTIDTGNVFGRFTTTNGEPYVKGPWSGDHWLFTIVPGRELAAGTKIAFVFHLRNTGTTHKYWTLEYLDGSEWKPVGDLLTATESIGDVTYSIMMPKTTTVNEITGDFTISTAMSTLKFRVVVGPNFSAAGKVLAAPSKDGTPRISSENGTLHNKFEIVK